MRTHVHTSASLSHTHTLAHKPHLKSTLHLRLGRGPLDGVRVAGGLAATPLAAPTNCVAGADAAAGDAAAVGLVAAGVEAGAGDAIGLATATAGDGVPSCLNMHEAPFLQMPCKKNLQAVSAGGAVLVLGVGLAAATAAVVVAAAAVAGLGVVAASWVNWQVSPRLHVPRGKNLHMLSFSLDGLSLARARTLATTLSMAAMAAVLAARGGRELGAAAVEVVATRLVGALTGPSWRNVHSVPLLQLPRLKNRQIGIRPSFDRGGDLDPRRPGREGDLDPRRPDGELDERRRGFFS
jgi:hypothetical protein